MRVSTFLAATVAVGAVGLAVVALPNGPAPDAELPNPTTEAAEPTAETGTSRTASRHRAGPSTSATTQDLQLSPDDQEGATSSVLAAADEQDYHGNVTNASELIVPCDNGSQPADLEDPLCVARWSVIHVAAGLLDPLDAQWIEPPLLDELSTSSSGAETGPPSELLVLDPIGRPNQVAPGRAEIEVIVERTWSTGELDHLFYRVTLIRSRQNTWSVIAIGRS